MKAVAAALRPAGIRVQIVASTPARVSASARLVASLGHAVVADGSEAEVILADHVAPPPGIPAVAIGAGFTGHEGWLPDDPSSEQIDAALRAVAAGLRVQPATTTARAFGAAEESRSAILLTARETEVLKAVSLGSSNKEIARELAISLHTVKFHLESLMRKLGVSSRTQAVSKALHLGLLEVFRV